MRCLVNDNQVGGNVDVQNNALGADYLFEVINVIPEQSAITIRVEGDNSAVRNFGHLAAMVVKQEPVLVPTPPTAIFLDNNSIDEENAIGEFVGSFTSDGVPAVTYSLVPGTGDDDNASFSITGDMLHIQTVADFETKPSYSIRVQASNSEGLLEETFIINVNDIVEGPPVEIISRINFGRNNSTTVPGWNNIFQNNPVSSLPAVTLNDENGNVLPWQLTVTNDFLSTPNEVGPITGNDSGRYPDDVLAYAWKDRYGGEVEISGLDDNLSYTIRVYGNTLDDEALMRCFVNSTQVGGTVDVQNNATGADYEFETTSVSSSQGKITIRIEGDNSSVRNFGHIAAMTIIQEVDTPPTAPTLLTLDNAVIDENNAVGALIGTLTSDGTDPVYSLVSGIGDDDNASFSISGDQLTINVSADFEAQSSYSVRVEASNGLGSFAEVFAISINDVDENITGPVTALINFGRNNSTTVPGWNNVFQNAPTTAMVPVSITDDQGNATTWQLGVANDFLSTPNAVGPITGNNSGRYPDDVLAYAWKDRYGGVIELSGLSNDQLYTIRVYGNTGEDEALTKVSVNSSQIGTVVDMKNNAIINDYEFEVIDISPIQGKITIEVAGDNSSTRNFGHMVAMVVIQQFSGSSSTRQSFFEDSKSVEFSELKIFPNPVKDDLIIIPSKDLQINKLELYQVIGQTSMNVEFEIETGNQDNQVISMAGYKPGLYVLRIHTNKEIKSYKIVKE
ncbi:MAG: T9SS type A sorting domain-containing protein [Bacteroidota bacterium]